MIITNFLYKNAKNSLLASYILFLISISLEYEVNFARTILLAAFSLYAFHNQNFAKKVFSSISLKIAAAFLGIAFCSWLITPYQANGLKTFDWLMYIVFGIGATLIWGKKTTLLLLAIPVTCFFASLATLSWGYFNDVNIDVFFTKNNRLFLYMGSSNRLGLLFLIASSISIGAAFLIKRLSIPLLLLASFLSIACWLSQSRSAIFALFGVIFLYSICALFHNRKNTFALFILTTTMALFCTQLSFAADRIITTIFSFDLNYLLNGRDDIWVASWEIFLKSPFVGFGVNSFHDALGAHLALPENIDRFPAIRSQYTFWNAHQMVLGILCETGIAGLVVFGILIVRGIHSGIKNFPETLPSLFALTAFLIHGIGGYGFHRSWNAALFFLPLGILEGWRIVATTHEDTKNFEDDFDDIG